MLLFTRRTVSNTLEFQWLLKETGTSPEAPQLNQPPEWKENQTFSTSPDTFLSPANTAGKQRISVFLHTCPLHRRDVVKMASLTLRRQRWKKDSVTSHEGRCVTDGQDHDDTSQGRAA